MRETRPMVILFTDTYPFRGPDDPFLPVEVRELATRVDLVVVPATRTEGPIALLPEGVALDLRLADGLEGTWPGTRGLAAAVFRPDGYREWWMHRRMGRPSDIATVMVRLGRMLAVERSVRALLPDARSGGDPVVYCWWSAVTAGGVARAVARRPIPLVTRMHGFDLYAEQDRLGWIPFQGRLVGRADLILTASQAGAEYLHDTYPDARERIVVGYLGIDGPAVPVDPSGDGVLRILSCSSCDEVKRVDLLAAGLASLAVLQPDLEFSWTHVGGGPTLERIRALIVVNPELARRCTLTGAVEPGQVREVLAMGPWDLFVNVSASEGLPVSLMEAASYGIPLMATAVGGSPEIVGPARGILLAADPTPDEIAEALAAFAVLEPLVMLSMRETSRATWEERFSASHNYAALADRLVAVRPRPID